MRLSTVIIFVIFILSLSMSFISLTSGLMPDYSNGVRTGEIIKLSNKGIIIKSNEGQMLLGGLSNNGETIGANIWSFSVEDPEITRKLQEAMEKKHKVTLHYRQYLMQPVKFDTEYIITRVEEK